MSDKKIPIVALIGMPNAGKSTLINRLANKKVAIVANEEHTTRDLNWGEEVWENMYMRFVDTGGIVPNSDDKIIKMVQLKTFSAIAQADLLVWVIDRRTFVDTISLEMMQRVWKSGKPFIIGINKVDNPNNEKNVSDYAHLGGEAFVNFSASNGYNLGFLMDEIVRVLEKFGFEKNNFDDIPVELIHQEKKTKRDRRKIVKQNQDGSYYVVRNENEDGGPGNFQSLTPAEIEGFEKSRKVEIENLVFDFGGVLFISDSEAYILDLADKNKTLDQENISQLVELVNYYNLNSQYFEQEDYIEFSQNFKELSGGIEFDSHELHKHFTVDPDLIINLSKLKKRGYNLYYCTNNTDEIFNLHKANLVFKLMDGGISSHEYTTEKPDVNFYSELINIYNIDPSKSIFIDDREENIQTALKMGFWGINYIDDLTDFMEEISQIEGGKVQRIKRIPKILFLGKPNVGKSSLFNAMVGKEIQIVSDIAGTTLSVNDTLVERIAEEPNIEENSKSKSTKARPERDEVGEKAGIIPNPTPKKRQVVKTRAPKPKKYKKKITQK